MPRGKWYISARAVRDYIELKGWENNEDSFARAEDDLIDLSKDAHYVMIQDNGLEQWRTGRKWGRIRCLVSTADRPEGDLPQLVGILPAHAKK